MDLFLITVAAIACYAISLYAWPFRPCPRCQGKGTNRGSNARRHGMCKRCGGTRHVQRLGSKTVHRAVRSIISYRKTRKDGKS
jgi:hypothetical protein